MQIFSICRKVYPTFIQNGTYDDVVLPNSLAISLKAHIEKEKIDFRVEYIYKCI